MRSRSRRFRHRQTSLSRTHLLVPPHSYGRRPRRASSTTASTRGTRTHTTARAGRSRRRDVSGRTTGRVLRVARHRHRRRRSRLTSGRALRVTRTSAWRGGSGISGCKRAPRRLIRQRAAPCHRQESPKSNDFNLPGADQCALICGLSCSPRSASLLRFEWDRREVG